MKTTSTQSNVLVIKKNDIIATLTKKKTLLIAIFSLLALALLAQENKPKHLEAGAGLFSRITANGYGIETVPSLYVRKGNLTLSAGPVIQKKRNNVCGGQLNVSYSVTGPGISGCCERTPELFFFTSCAYNSSAYLGKTALLEESMANPASTENHIETYKFKSVEFFAGAGLRIKLFKFITWHNSLGLGAYTTLNYPTLQNLYYSKTNAGLTIRTGITIKLYSKN